MINRPRSIAHWMSRSERYIGRFPVTRLPEWDLRRMNPVGLAVGRLAVELHFEQKVVAQGSIRAAFLDDRVVEKGQTF